MEVKRVAHLEGTTEIEEENIRATGHIPTTEFWTQFLSSVPWPPGVNFIFKKMYCFLLKQNFVGVYSLYNVVSVSTYGKVNPLYVYIYPLLFGFPSHLGRASLRAQLINNLPTMWETWVRSLGWEDPLEKGKTTHSSILAWRTSWTVYVQSVASQRVRQDWATFTFPCRSAVSTEESLVLYGRFSLVIHVTQSINCVYTSISQPSDPFRTKVRACLFSA